MPSGRQATLIVWFVGMSVLIGLTVWYGADHVGSAMISAGWATVLVVIARVAAVGEQQAAEYTEHCRNHEQGEGGEHFRRAGAADGPERRRDEEAAAAQDDGDRTERYGDLGPRNAGVSGPATDDRNGSHERDEGEILEQQHRESVPARWGAELVVLGQHGQDDRGR